MDADSSYGGSDTAQDSHSGHDNSSSLETTHNDVTTTVHDVDTQQQEPNNFYHKNEITLPVNYDETDFQENKSTNQPHYLTTANLNINDTLEHHSNLEEMSKNYKSTSYLNESPRIQKKSNEGVDNPAFQEEEYKPEVKSTFDNNKPYNGDLNSSAMMGLTSPNKNEEPLTEAVNLELINLKPTGKDVTGAYENGTNGMTSIPVKKENDAEIGNPYDEYFVPVNEHRKYMRGEKLYVTMDKRNKKKRNKCLCWGLCLCIVAAAVIIGILAAVGVIGNQGPHPIQEVSARHFGSASSDEAPIQKGGIFGLPKDIINETTPVPESSTRRLTPGPPVVTVSSMLPSTETSMIQVPRALESQFVIDNLEFTPALNDKNSTEYQKLANELETVLKNSLFSSDVLNYGAADIDVKVMDFASGSVVVKYRVTWVFKDGIHNAKDPINEESLQRKVKNIVGNSNGFMNTYHVVDNSVVVERILDLCQIDNHGCEYNCSFDYKLADFICSCPDGKYLKSDQKSCTEEQIISPKNEEDVYLHESHYHTTIHPEPEPSSEPEPTHDHHHDHHTTIHSQLEPEPSSEPEPTHDHDHHNHHTTINPQPEPEPSSEPEPTHDQQDHHFYYHTTVKPEPEPSPEPTPTHDHDDHYHLHHGSEPTAEPEPTSEPVTESKSVETYYHSDEVLPEPVAPEPEPTNKPEEVSHENYVHFQHGGMSDIETTSEPKAEPTTQSYGHNDHHIVAVPVEPELNIEMTTEKQVDSTEPIPNVELTTKSNEETNVVGVSSASTEQTLKHDHETEVVAEPTPEPLTEHKPIITTKTTVEHFMHHDTLTPVAEPTPEPEPEPTSEPIPEPTTMSNNHNLHSIEESNVEHHNSEHNTEPGAEPTPEPTIEHNTEPVAEPLPVFPLEHNTELIPQTTLQPSLEHNSQNQITSDDKNVELSDHLTETSSQPTSKAELEVDTNTVVITPPTTMENVTDKIKVVDSSDETITESSASFAIHTGSETSAETRNETHFSVSTTESSPRVTTLHSFGNEFRHNHLASEIFADSEVTTTMNSQLHKVSSTESTTSSKELNSSVSTNIVFEQSITANTLTPEVQSEMSTMPNTDEATTLQLLPETSNAKETHEENLLIPVSINEQARHLHVGSSTEQPPENHTNEISVVVNDEPLVLHSDDIQIKNITTTQKPEEITTQPIDITKAFTEMHQPNHSTETILDASSNNTNMHGTVVESTENTSAMDNMSPFLPEIDNDTFVNKLHLGEHVIPHIQNETHDDEAAEMSPPPHLDNDQMNVTNPLDYNVTDSALKVVPLEGNENEIVDNITETKSQKVDNEPKSIESHVVPVLVQHEAPVTTTEASLMVTHNQNEQSVVVSNESEPHLMPTPASQEPVLTTTVSSMSTENEVETNKTTTFTESNGEIVNSAVNNNVSSSNTTPVPMTTTSFGEAINITLSPEILNNVHSNKFFENADRKQEENKSDINDYSTSTEDLIALETTTNRERVPENKIMAVDQTTEISNSNRYMTTIHAEIVDTVTESVHFTNDVNTTNVYDTIAANKTDTNLIKTAVDETETTTTTSNEMTTIPPPDSSSNVYEVNESIADVTTTEKIFVTAKSTTENAINTKADYEDLSVVPLDSEDENETSKVNEKRVVHDTTSQLDADTNDSFNDISEEEQIVMDKFHHNDNDINAFNENSDAATTSKTDEIANNNTENDGGLSKYDENKAGKKSYYDKEKSKFEKKVKLEKVISTITDDELLTSSAPNDKQPHPFSDIRPVTEDFAIPDFARCTYGQFHCVNGTSVKDGSYCIPENDRCDSVDDCSDASDEIDCVKNGCPNNFQCASGQCLKRHLVCDGIQNCNDGSDETGCDHWTCRFDEFSCGSGSRCLPILWKCDSRSQCPDGSDEHNCPSSQCNEDSFHCTEQNTCVSKNWRCDGQSDCLNAEDEKSCDCVSDDFKCAIGGGCIKKEQMCDGTPQCADQSDEWNCLRLDKESNNKKILEVRVSNSSWYPICSNNWNQTYSDFVCRSLGYGGSTSTENIDKQENCDVCFKLKTDLVYGASILSQLEKADNCDAHISITCQEFACGSHSTLDIQSARIIGGNRGVESQWPSLTLLYNRRLNLQCTATLIAPTWIVASYSCIFNSNSRAPVLPSDWILYAGSTNFFGNPDNSTVQVGQIKRILPHPQAKYLQFEYTNDVVLVELTKPLTLTRNVSAMCLPDKDIEPRQLCVIAGWGVSKPGEPSKNQYLHYLPVPIIDSAECNSTKHYNGLMSKDKICAGYTDSEKTPCYNDEGAPLMCFSDSAGTWELQGILSHHDNCAKSKHPAIYTSINENMRKWVINTIGQKPARSA